MIKRSEPSSLSKSTKILLIIVLIFMSIGMIFLVVKGIIQKGTDQDSLDKFTADLKISQVSIINYTDVNVRVERNAGEGEIDSINFVVYGEDNSKILLRKVSMEELEEKDFQIVLHITNTSRIKTISIAPVFISESGKKIVGKVEDEYEISSGEEYSEEEIPSCTLDSECGDNNICTNDVCLEGECSYSVIANCISCTLDSECEDNNACTTNTCSEGTCSYSEIIDCVPCEESYQCEDSNACTTNKCSGGKCTYLAIPGCTPCGFSSHCNDNNSCTDDICFQGRCLYNSIANCTPCTLVSQCEDNDSCTNNICLGGVCSYSAISGCKSCTLVSQCEDNNVCTNDTCSDGKCSYTPIPNCTSCTSNSQCNDSNACTTDACSNGMCSYNIISGCKACTLVSQCEDNNACTTNTCSGGVCSYPTISGCKACISFSQCNDDDICTTNTCLDNKCVYPPITLCKHNDGCCPSGSGCNSINDNNCPAVCQNGVREGTEKCDGSSLGGATCAGVMGSGYTGTLKCSSSCTFDTSSCIPPCTCPDEGNPCTADLCSNNVCQRIPITDCCTSSLQCGSNQVCNSKNVCATINPVTGKIYYVSTSGSDSTGDGSIAKPWFTLNKAWTVVAAGDLIYMRGGTYRYNRQYLEGKNGIEGKMIRVEAYSGEKPVIVKASTYYSSLSSGSIWPAALIYLKGDYIHFKGLEIANHTQESELVWSGLVVMNSNHCIFEQLNIHHCGNGASFENINDCLILNSDFHHNYDPLTYYDVYGNADGVGMVGNDISHKNIVRGCRFWWNTDDGLDLYAEEGNVIIENSWAWYNGFIPGTFEEAGDGSGFKLGLTNTNLPNTVLRTVTNCVSFYNKKWGFLDNNAKCNMKLYNNIAYQNCYRGYDSSWCGGFNFNIIKGIPYYIKNNIAYDNAGGTNAALDVLTNINHNSWDSAVSVSNSDFLSVVPTGVDGPRQADGSLPNLNFLRLASGSDLIDKGVNVGLPYSGIAPDLGAFEYTASVPTCSDGIKNGAETGIDCGGSCSACSSYLRTFYVSSSIGSDSTGDGSIGKPWFTLNKAWTVVAAGDTVYMRGGTYRYNSEQKLSGKSGTVGNMINIWAYPGEMPIISPSSSFTDYIGISISGVNYLHLKGLEITGFEQKESSNWYNGITAGNVNNCIFELLNVHHNGFGFSIGNWGTGTSSGNLVLNSDFHHNSDPLTHIEDNLPWGGSDGLTIRVSDPNSINTIRGCRMWWNSDDGVDLWENEGMIIIENSWAFWNGFQPGNFAEAGDGNGFKLGPTYAGGTPLKRKINNNLAFQNKLWGFLDNAAECNMQIYNNIAYKNCYQGYETWCGGFYFRMVPGIPYYIKNNIAYDNAGGTNAALDVLTNINHNSWDSAVSVSNSDFLSVVPTGVDGPRQADGSLPNLNFLRLASGSDLIDKGVNVGLPYSGIAPDLGAFERS